MIKKPHKFTKLKRNFQTKKQYRQFKFVLIFKFFKEFWKNLFLIKIFNDKYFMQ